jgi:hypothetical protein
MSYIAYMQWSIGLYFIRWYIISYVTDRICIIKFRSVKILNKYAEGYDGTSTNVLNPDNGDRVHLCV